MIGILSSDNSNKGNICSGYCPLNKFPDNQNICSYCDASCSVGYCTVGLDLTKCTKCASSSLFLNS